jgi:hypothetical protein
MTSIIPPANQHHLHKYNARIALYTDNPYTKHTYNG